MEEMNVILEDIKPELKSIVKKLLLVHGKKALLAVVEKSENKIDDVVAAALLPAFEAELLAQIEKA